MILELLQHFALLLQVGFLEFHQEGLDDFRIFTFVMVLDLFNHGAVAGLQVLAQESDSKYTTNGDMRGADWQAKL